MQTQRADVDTREGARWDALGDRNWHAGTCQIASCGTLPYSTGRGFPSGPPANTVLPMWGPGVRFLVKKPDPTCCN